MFRRNLRLTAVPVAAAALTLTAVGYQASAAGTPDAGGDAGSGKAASATVPCLSGATTLIGDLDGDNRPDQIINPGHTGTRMTVQWGAADGSFGSKQNVAELLGVKTGEVATAAVADFQNDGTLDMVVNLVTPSGADDPNTARVAEFRPGPLKRSNLGSAAAKPSDIGTQGEAKQLRIANYGDDAYPDLAVLNNAGDGVWERSIRLTKPGGGPGSYDYELQQKYGETGTPAEPPAMPTDGWKHFYKSCS